MKLWPMVFIAGAILSWGCYVPTIHAGQVALGGGFPSKGGLRAFLCVGIAYFLTAVVVPLVLLYSTNLEERTFNASGLKIATLAGVLGAAGALCIILSIKTGGLPIYIAPLVFAGAPIVNVMVTMLLHRPANAPSPLFYAGLLMAAIGAGMVLYFKPAEVKHVIKPAVQTTAEPTPPAH